MDRRKDLIEQMIEAVKSDFAEGKSGLAGDDIAFFDALELQIVQALVNLQERVILGQALIDIPLRLSIKDDEPRPTGDQLQRRLRVGFLATTGDPVHWGHVLRALADADEFRLDTVILQVIGDHPHKPGKQPKLHRHAIARLVAETFYPVIRYCPVGYDNLAIGEQNAAEFLLFNASTEIDLFFLAGDDVAVQAIRNIEACNQLLGGAHHETRSIQLNIIASQEAAEAIYPQGSLPTWVICRTKPSHALPECRGLRISSLLFRTYPELPLLPHPALEYVHRHGLYQSIAGHDYGSHLDSMVILSFLPPGLHQLIVEDLSDARELLALNPHGHNLTSGILGDQRITLLGAAGKEASLLPVMEQAEVSVILGIGLCGSLQSWLAPGEIIIPASVVRGDGITDYWVDAKFPPAPDFKLFRALIEAVESLGLKVHVGSLYTTASLAKEKQIAAVFAPLGVLGVEMELALHWTLAMVHHKRAASIYVVSDNVTLGDDILRDGIAETPRLQRAVREAIAIAQKAISFIRTEEGAKRRKNE